MKKIIVLILAAICALLSPLSIFASITDTTSLQKNEINSLNSLDAKDSLLTESGGRCWTTDYTDNQGYHLTKKECDDEGDPNQANMFDPGNPMTYVRYALLIALCWWIYSLVVNAGK
jgi:hypothetical protein